MYVKIASWHQVLTPTRAFNTYRTLCGRTVTTDPLAVSRVGPLDELPLDEKSCETCLRLATKRD
jgi:hypothetical protein